MKRLLFTLVAVLAVASSGCLRNQTNDGCRKFGHAHQPPEFNQPGPPAATVAYPYYTTRGPRDFLQNNPPSIGY